MEIGKEMDLAMGQIRKYWVFRFHQKSMKNKNGTQKCFQTSFGAKGTIYRNFYR